ncbi:hypothetical protein LCGC14_1583350 [marine sediment metagenome]|uniref:Uncharacterized protein n=1 Tax=marine sediment metagenome TaxID=412755 RepID=A0A0F9IG81_9ZZZZ
MPRPGSDFSPAPISTYQPLLLSWEICERTPLTFAITAGLGVFLTLLFDLIGAIGLVALLITPPSGCLTGRLLVPGGVITRLVALLARVGGVNILLTTSPPNEAGVAFDLTRLCTALFIGDIGDMCGILYLC